MFDISDADVDVLRDTFRKVSADAALTGTVFYDRLFVIAPELRPLFPADMEQQGVKLMSMLGAIVARIDDHAALGPLVTDLARRHQRYGAQPTHYEKVGDALLWTLSSRLGEGFDVEARDAWERAYTRLAEVMLDAAWPSA